MEREPKSIPFAAIAVRSLTEVTIIIAGILIALGVNDWWGNRLDRAEEHKILESIQEDVGASLTLIQNTRARVEGDLRKLKILSAGSAGDAGKADREGLVALLHSLWDVPPLTTQTSTHKELQTSGRLRLISDPRVRRQLAHFQQKYEFAVLTHLDAFQHQQSKLDPYLLANIQMAQLSRYAFENDAGPNPEQLTPLAPLKDHRGLLDDAQFQNHVAAKYFLLTYFLQQTRELTAALDEINAELAK